LIHFYKRFIQKSWFRLVGDAMPAGVSWPTYLKFSLAAALSMIAGAQTVHHLYRPLDDLDSFIKNFEEESSKVNTDTIDTKKVDIKGEKVTSEEK